MSKIFALALMATIGVAVGLTPRDSEGNGLEALQAEVAAARSKIIEFDLGYSFVATHANASAVTTDSRRVQWLDGLLATERTYGTAERLWQVNAGYDGEFWWTRRPNSAGVAITTSLARAREMHEFNSQGGGFADLMLWFPEHELRHATLHPLDLRSILQQPNMVLRHGMEYVGEFHCHVVDEVNPSTGDVLRTFWVDPARGYLPVRHRSADGSYEFRIDEAVEVATGVWLPSRGRRLTGAGAAVEMPNATEYVLEVQFAHVNHGGLEPGDFGFAADLPAGTAIFDLDNDVMWTVAANSYSDVADAVLQSVRIQSRTANTSAATGGERVAWKNPAWISLIALIGIASAFRAAKCCR